MLVNLLFSRTYQSLNNAMRKIVDAELLVRWTEVSVNKTEKEVYQQATIHDGKLATQVCEVNEG